MLSHKELLDIVCTEAIEAHQLTRAADDARRRVSGYGREKRQRLERRARKLILPRDERDERDERALI